MSEHNVEKNEMKLEAAMSRLGEIIKLLEAENTDLDGSLRLYEEGIRLVRICNEQLSEAERKIRILRISPDGEVSEENFIPDEKKV